MFQAFKETLDKIATFLDKPEVPPENKGITQTVESAESLYKYGRSLFDSSFTEIEKADKKTHYYLIFTNLLILLISSLLSVIYKQLNLDFTKPITLNIWVTIYVLCSISACVLLGIIIYFCLLSLRQRKFNGPPHTDWVNRNLHKNALQFWLDLFEYYHDTAMANFDAAEVKKQYIIRAEKLLHATYILLILGVLSYGITLMTNSKGILIQVK